MLKRRSKVLALVLATVFLVTFVTACGTAPAPEAATATAPASNTSTSAASTGTNKMFDKTLTVKWMMPESNQQKMLLDAPSVKAIYDLLNVKLELVPVPESDYETKASTVLAGNDMPDVLGSVSADSIAQYAPSGMFVCLDDYKDAAKDYYDLMNGDSRAIETKKFLTDGKMYGFMTLEYFRIAVAPLPVIRADLLEEQNIPMPTSWDELYAALLKIKQKYPDIYAFASRSGTNYLLGNYAYPLGSGGFPTFNSDRGMYYEPTQDKYLYGPTSPAFQNVVGFFAKAYQDKLLDPDYATMKKDQYFEKLSSGKLVFSYDNNSHAARVFNPALKKVSDKARFDLIPPLANSTGTTRAYRYERDWGTFSVISSKVKEPEKVVKFINWMYTDQGRLVTNFGIEGVNYEMKDGKPMIVQSIVDKHKNDPDPFTGIQGELGVGFLGYAKYVDETTYSQVTDPFFIEMGKRIDQYTAEKKVVYLPNWPPFTKDEAEKLKDLEVKLTNVFNQEIDKFITGKSPMSSWPDFVKQLKSQGSEEVEKIFNDAYVRLK